MVDILWITLSHPGRRVPGLARCSRGTHQRVTHRRGRRTGRGPVRALL